MSQARKGRIFPPLVIDITTLQAYGWFAHTHTVINHCDWSNVYHHSIRLAITHTHTHEFPYPQVMMKHMMGYPWNVDKADYRGSSSSNERSEGWKQSHPSAFRVVFFGNSVKCVTWCFTRNQTILLYNNLFCSPPIYFPFSHFCLPVTLSFPPVPLYTTFTTITTTSAWQL